MKKKLYLVPETRVIELEGEILMAGSDTDGIDPNGSMDKGEDEVKDARGFNIWSF